MTKVLAKFAVKFPKTSGNRNRKLLMAVERQLQNPPQAVSVEEFPVVVFIAGGGNLFDHITMERLVADRSLCGFSESKFFRTLAEAEAWCLAYPFTVGQLALEAA